jgi:fucose permease
MKNENNISKIIPVMLAFFTMGFCDLVGVATNYVKQDFQLSDTFANLLATIMFIWFLVFSVPTGLLMNRIGRKKTVLISIGITFIGLLVPYLSYSLVSMLVVFSLIGIGNTLMQVSLNPLISNLVTEKKLPSYLTLGQFIKAIASFIAPILAAQAAILYGDWKLLFPVFAVIAIIAVIYLASTEIKEKAVEGKPSSFGECFALLRNGLILALFLGILVHVGIDVGVNVTAPKLLQERTGLALSDAVYINSFYFLFRVFGCFVGAFILSFFSPRKFFIISIFLLLAGIAVLFAGHSLVSIYTGIALMGIGNSNVFPILFSNALQHNPTRSNEISGLMIMGIAGGAIFPFLMGVVSDAMGNQAGALIVLAVCIAYLLFIITKLKK